MNALVQEEEEAAHFQAALFKLQGNHPTIIWLITDIINSSSSSSKRSSENCTQLCVDSEVALQLLQRQHEILATTMAHMADA
ncbi:hypothetical protein ACLKA6_015427 [Drosophila palustris]